MKNHPPSSKRGVTSRDWSLGKEVGETGSLPNLNTIVINKMDLNIQKNINYPPSPVYISNNEYMHTIVLFCYYESKACNECNCTQTLRNICLIYYIIILEKFKNIICLFH